MSSPLSPPSASATPASAFFTFEKQAASLSDLDIVRKIVEREGCLEALEQLLRGASTRSTTQSSAMTEIEQVYPYTYPRRGIGGGMRTTTTAAASPMVLQSLLDQLRSVSVQIIEAIERWRKNSQTQVFQWRQVNYLVKMARDLDFLATISTCVDALQHVRLERNPFLAPLHLDHPALRESTPDAAVQLGVGVGSVDMRRVFYASKVLLRELEFERKQQQLTQAQSRSSNSVDNMNDSDSDSGCTSRDGDINERMHAMTIIDPSVLSATKQQRSQHEAMRVRWSNQDVRSVQARSITTLSKPLLMPLTDSNISSSNNNNLSSPLGTRDRVDEMRRDLEVSRDLIQHAEHELGAIREEVAMLQTKLAEALTQPERRRKLQAKLGALVNALKFRSGDLFQRKNDLRRKEAAFRLASDRSSAGTLCRTSNHVGAIYNSAVDNSDAAAGDASESQPHAYLRAVHSAMQEDELRRQVIVEKFMALARMRAAGGSGGNGGAMPSTSRHKQKQQLGRHAPSPSRKTSSPSANTITTTAIVTIASTATTSTRPQSISDMSPDAVAMLVDSLGLSCNYGSKFQSQGIDGALLLQATDSDLEELGVSLRLHRVRILEAIARVHSTR